MFTTKSVDYITHLFYERRGCAHISPLIRVNDNKDHEHIELPSGQYSNKKILGTQL